MYLTHTDKSLYYIIDIETDGLKPTTIHCVVIKNWGTGQVWKFLNDGSSNLYHAIHDFVVSRGSSAIWVGHNAISFDIPVLNRFCALDIPISSIVDTLCLSYLFNPHLLGGHSLDAYGERVGIKKVQNEDWTELTDNLLSRCESDVEITQLVYEGLIRRMTAVGYSEKSCEIEHRIREIIDRQQERGFWFNTPGARDLRDFLRHRQSDLAEQVHKLFPPELAPMGTYPFRRRKDGSPFASYEKHVAKYDRVEFSEDGSEYTCYQTHEFNIGSPKQRIERLMSLGWEPVKFTKKGNPQLDEDSLNAYAELSGRPEIAGMADYLVHFGRANMLDTWLACVGVDSRMHGNIFTCGASTRRMTHNSPNTANIPSGAKAKYGHECRALWGVEPNKGLIEVGVDASGLENVGLLNYLNNPKATAILNTPKPNDVHSVNSRRLTEALGRPVDREWGAKTSWYAWLFGAYPPKLGSIVKGPPSDGDIIVETFFSTVPGLKGLIDRVHSEFKHNHGRLKTIDGGSVICPSVNASLNYKIQSLGAIVMKLASIRLDQLAKEQGLEFHLCGTIHDEFQMETKEENGKKLGELAVQSITEAAEELNFNLPLTGEFKLGRNWSECH